MRWIKASIKPPTGIADEYSWRRASDKRKFNPLLNINGNTLEYAWLRSEFSFDEVEYLDETPPALELMAIEKEANELYPFVAEQEVDYFNVQSMNEIADAQRSAHITAARQYMDTIDKLRAENEKLRKALEEIAQKYADAEVIDDIGQFVFEMGEIATSALKTNTHG